MNIINNPLLTQIFMGPVFLSTNINVTQSGLTTLNGFASGIHASSLFFMNNPGLCVGEINAFVARIILRGTVQHNAAC